MNAAPQVEYIYNDPQMCTRVSMNELLEILFCGKPTGEPSNPAQIWSAQPKDAVCMRSVLEKRPSHRARQKQEVLQCQGQASVSPFCMLTC